MNAAVAVLVPVAALLLGRPVVRRLDAECDLKWTERLLAATAVGCLPLAAAVWVIGSLRYDGPAMAGVLAVALAVGLALNGRRPPTLPAGLRPRSRVETLIAGLCLALALAEVLTALAPPSDHDSLRYHLALARRDLEEGRLAVHYGWSAYEFFPPLAPLLTRIAFALGSAQGAQVLNALWAPVAALAALAVAHRLGAGRIAALGAAAMVLSTRMVIHLAGGVGVDLPLAAFAGTLFVLLAVLAEKPQPRLGLLTGLTAAALVNTKHQGLVAVACLCLPLLPALFGSAQGRRAALTAAATAAALLTPWLIRNGLVTGNPLFPAFHHVIAPEGIDIFADGVAANRHGSGLGFMLAVPWLVFIEQQRFDGLHFGFPLILIGLPFALPGAGRIRWAALAAVVLYLLAWAAIMPQMLRFLLPMLPLMAALAAVGLERAAALGRVHAAARLGLASALGLAILVQGGFLAATLRRKVPPVLGLESAETYLAQPAFRWSAHAEACGFVAARLEDGEHWLGLMNDPSYYCPQASAFPQIRPGDEADLYTRRPLPAVAPAELAEAMKQRRVRWVLVVNNLGVDVEPLVFAKHRYDRVIEPVLAGLAPSFIGPTARVYQGADVIRALGREAR